MGGKPVPMPLKEDQEHILCVPDLERAGTKKLPRHHAEFINHGSTEQITVNENSTAYHKYRVRPRVLVDVSKRDTSSTLWGRSVTFPLGIAPAGLHSIADKEHGELATVRASARKGLPMGISSFATYLASDIAKAGRTIGSIDHAMQCYTFVDRGRELKLIREAEAAGCKAIFLTADSPVLGVRYNETRNDFRIPEDIDIPNLGISTAKYREKAHGDTFNLWNDPAQNWEREIPWLRSVTKMEIWIKGVVTAEDTLKAIEMGCDGIIVSNHGGRQLDGIPATIDALPECVEAARGRIRIHVDGGIRSGTDIFKALALGAEHVWIGRPVLWGLAVSVQGQIDCVRTRRLTQASQYNGEKGVDLLLELLHTEFKRCMQLAGCNRVQDITKACLGVVRHDGPLARL